MADSVSELPPPTLDSLSSDLHRHIASFLPRAADLAAFSRVDKRFDAASMDVRRHELVLSAKAFHDAYSFHHCRNGPCRWAAALPCCDWLERSAKLHIQALPKHVLQPEQALVLVHTLSRRRRDGPELNELVFDCAVSEAALLTLARALPSAAAGLTRLSLAGCGVRDPGALAIAESVPLLPALRDLCMEDNPFSPSARGRLRLACKQCRVTLTAFSEIENESLYE